MCSCSALRAFEPPRPIVVRVDEVGRAEAVAYEAATCAGGSARSHDQVFLEPLHRRFLFAPPGHRRGATGPGSGARNGTTSLTVALHGEHRADPKALLAFSAQDARYS